MILFDQAGAGATTATMLAPPPALRPFVEHIWTQGKITAPADQRWRIPPDANPYLIFTVTELASGEQHARCRLVGPATDFFDMPVGGRVFTCGVRLRPGLLPTLAPLSASELTNGAQGVEEAFGARGRQLLERLVDPASRIDAPRLMTDFLERELVHRDAFQLLPARRARSVREFADMVGWSPRTLQNRVSRKIGFPPKLWLRIERLHRAIASSMGSTEPWSDIAARCGFSDQAHMIREFVDLLGEPPNAWRRRGPFVPSTRAVDALSDRL